MQKSMYNLYTCDVCKDKFNFRDIKYSMDGKKIVCAVCFNKELKKDSRSSKREYAEANKANTIRVICADCRYKFHINVPSPAALRCPYCGKNNLVRDETTAERLIEEASRAAEKERDYKRNVA